MANKPSDIESIRKLREDFENYLQLGKALPILRPFLNLAGVDTKKVDAAMSDLAQRKTEFDALVQTMDRFNELFAVRGWIAYDLLNIGAANAAIAAAESGRMSEAERILVQHYDGDQVALHLRAMRGLSCFRDRMRLADLALTDYRERRFHACVPVVLALLDGMVNDLANQGFFSQKVELTAWDSIATCDGGIGLLKTILSKPRKKTTVDPIDLPYRNGIHHGMDLGYDNELVAAKSWVALFAVADWARRIEQGKKNAPAPDPAATWGEIVQVVNQNRERRKRLDSWKPCSRKPGSDPFENRPDSPEIALDEFLNAWRAENYGLMAKRTHPFGPLSINARAGEVRRYYQDLSLDDFSILEIEDTAPAVTEITVRGRGAQYGISFDGVGKFRLVKMDEIGDPIISGESGGTWFVMTWNPWQPPYEG
jgi:hypothetical protein